MNKKTDKIKTSSGRSEVVPSDFALGLMTIDVHVNFSYIKLFAVDKLFAAAAADSSSPGKLSGTSQAKLIDGRIIDCVLRSERSARRCLRCYLNDFSAISFASAFQLFR